MRKQLFQNIRFYARSIQRITKSFDQKVEKIDQLQNQDEYKGEDLSEQFKLFSINQDKIQQIIQNINSFQNFIQVYNIYNENATLNNYLSFFNIAIRYYEHENEQNKDFSIFYQHKQIQEIIQYLQDDMQNFTDNQFLNLLQNMTKINYQNQEFLQEVIAIIQEKDVIIDIKSIEYILSLKLKYNIINEQLLSKLAQQVDQKMNIIPLNQQVQVFYILNQLKYYNEVFYQKYEAIFMKNIPRYQIDQILMILSTYQSNQQRLLPNLNLFDQIGLRLLRISSQLNIEQIQQTVRLFKQLNYSNNFYFQSISVKIIQQIQPLLYNEIDETDDNLSKFFQKMEEEDQEYKQQIQNENENQEKDNEDYTFSNKIQVHGEGVTFPQKKVYVKNSDHIQQNNETSQIQKIEDFKQQFTVRNATHLLYCLNELDFRDQDLLTTLELYFIQNLQTNDMKSLIEFCYVKKFILQDLLEKYDSNKDEYYHRSLKNLKKYFNFFYEVSLPIIKERQNELQLNELQSFLESSLLITGQKGGFYKNIVRKQLINLGLDHLERVEEKEKEKVIFDLFRVVLQLCFEEKKEMSKVVECFSKKGYDLSLMHSRYGHTVLVNKIEKE